MGRRKAKPIPLFVATEDLPAVPSVPFLERLNAILEKNGFDRFVEDLCQQFYAERLGRPSLPPGVYFRFLMLGLLMDLDSERRIALLVNDSLSLRAFVSLRGRTGQFDTVADSPADHEGRPRADSQMGAAALARGELGREAAVREGHHDTPEGGAQGNAGQCSRVCTAFGGSGG